MFERIGTMLSMRMPWSKSKSAQLNLLDDGVLASAIDETGDGPNAIVPVTATSTPPSLPALPRPREAPACTTLAGQPLLVPTASLYEDPNNPRTEFPEAEIAELAEDIRQRGILQPLVVHPANVDGGHCIHFGAKRLRAAVRAALHEVPVVVRDMHADRYAQVAENQKRHGLSPLDMARFIRAQVDAGDSNATVARQLGMNLTTVAHHLALLDLPPELDKALKSGRCTSPRTLHELSRLHADSPGQVQALLTSGAEITRKAVTAIRTARGEARVIEPTASSPDKLIAQANAVCDRLDRLLYRIELCDASLVATPNLVTLRGRVEAITKRWLQGSDRHTPSQAER